MLQPKRLDGGAQAACGNFSLIKRDIWQQGHKFLAAIAGEQV
ncbi:hypothetical protein HNQ08_002943 [Deinococcus humi]|uniref:Uncharacterized protein n=1 Tax=Deinococcus humi TaxID=662880 RepID=A0A7W8JY18_9DEIO|nr:hypothetical protein [Deinococcus humi]GGO31800.1 hypothetical protein GCM10008949_28370 [Deinococcus humi]